MRNINLEQYFTTTELVEQCLDRIKKHYDINKFSLIIEPSAGDGAFSNLLPCDKTIAFDIEPRHCNILKQDFLAWQPSNSGLDLRDVLVIGNPPFGRRGMLASKFIKHATKFSSVICFILPRTFKKDSFKNSVPLNLHLIEEFDCDTFRSPSGDKITIKCVFQIWEKRDVCRTKKIVKSIHEDFIMKHAHISRISKSEFNHIKENYDFSLPQVGMTFKPIALDKITKGSHWFIKVLDESNKAFFDKLDFSFIDNMNLSFNSISKSDIVTAYENAKNNI